MRFIYVLSKDGCQKLLSCGGALLHVLLSGTAMDGGEKTLYVFENSSNLDLSTILSKEDYFLSNTLAF